MSRRLVVLACVLLGAAGCSSSHKTAQRPASPTRAGFVREANGICKTYDAKFNRLPQPRAPAEVGPYVDRASGLIEKELGKLRAVAAPTPLAARYRRFLASGAQELRLTRRLAAAAKAGDATAVRRLIAAGQRMDAHANVFAKEIGLRACAQPSSAG